MPYELPSWLQKTAGPFDASGAAQDAYNSSFQHGLNLRTVNMQQQEQDALLPLKVAQAKQALAGSALDIKMKMDAQDDENATKSGFIAANQALSNNDEDAFWKAFADNPKLNITPAGVKLRDAGAKAFSDSNNIEKALSVAKTVADTRLAGQATAYDRAIDAANINWQGRLDVATKQQDEATKRAAAHEASRLSIAEQKSENDLELMKMRLQSQGFRLDDYEVLAAIKGEIEAINKDMTLSAAQNQLKIQSVLGRYRGMAKPIGATAPPAAVTPTPAAAPPVGAKYSTAQDVVSAFKAGKLGRDEAAKILRDQFGAK